MLAGISTHISFHTARHTNATLLVYKGVNITTVQKLLGHKNIRTTQYYADILPQGIVNDLEKECLEHYLTHVRIQKNSKTRRLT